MAKQICIGYWGNALHPDTEYPMPVANTALLDQDEVIEKLICAMENGYMESYRGSSTCRICHKLNGWKELEIIRGDTKYSIPEGYLHYLVDHRVGYDPRLKEIL